MISGIVKRYKEPIKKIYIQYRRPIMGIYLPLLRLGNKKKCNVCQKTFGSFTKFKGGSSYLPDWIVKLQMIGSDVDNFACPYCNSFDRERHLFMYFDRLSIWDKIKGARVLHFAPEPQLSRRIEQNQPVEYIKGDLFPANGSIRKTDITAIDFADNTFDLVLANHVMEHVPAYRKAMNEVCRVLKPGGVAILQAPFSKILEQNFEDDGINTSDLRLFFYAQRDHVRVFSEKVYLSSLEQAGFDLALVRHGELFTDRDAYYFGVNKHEDLIRVVKRKA